jgi:Bardet-Biedl syndrome 4 protein
MSQVQDETDSALEFYKKAHKISPNSAPLWNNLGIHMYEKKKIIAAYSCFKRALFLDPFRWDIHANLGLLFMKHRK